ncbi:MAG: hypothetical protein U0264_11735 [Candidatus Kapaibacterium sp.]
MVPGIGGSQSGANPIPVHRSSFADGDFMTIFHHTIPPHTMIRRYAKEYRYSIPKEMIDASTNTIGREVQPIETSPLRRS